MSSDGQAEAALFERGAWTKALEKYAAVTHLTIQLYDTDARLICGPVHPTDLFELFTPGYHDLGIFAACIRRCLTQADMPPPVVVENHDGLAVVGTALMLSGEIVGVAVAGYALTTFMDQHALERLARNSGCSFEIVWAVGRKERPLPGERLALYGELLRTLGNTLLEENFSTRREQQISTRLAEALASEQAARAEAETATALVRRVQALTDMALDLPLDDLLRELLTRLRNELQTDTAVILLRQLAEEGGEEELRVRAALGLEEEEQRQARIPVGQGFAGRIAAERRPIVMEDVDNYEVANRFIREKGLHSLAGVPLQIDGRVIGVLHVGSMRRRKFQQQEVELLRLAGDRIALAIQRTEVRAAAAAVAEAADRAKDAFLATLSHELRSPLAAILTWVHLLRRGKLDATKTAGALETIERSAKAQKHLIEDLLDVSRVVAGKLRLETQPVDLAEAIEAAVDVVRPAAQAKSVELESMLRGFRHGRVLGDPGRLQQVICNLLTNAIKFTPKGGRVAVWLEVVDSRAEIVVSDTGEGISPDFLPHVFERFRQADSTSTRAHSGLGLGLAIVRHLVELHGGTVRAESRGENKGTTFRVTLPLLSRELSRWENVSPTAGGEVPYDCHLVLEGVRVLVVDDEADVREWLTAVLAESRAAVTTVASAGEAFEALERMTPDVLMSDIGMPGEDGYALIRKVRTFASERGGQVPALALTGFASTEDRAQALAAGYQVHMSKPVDPAALVAAVAELVATPRPRLPAACLAKTEPVAIP